MVKKEGCWVRRGVIATCCVKGPLHLKATAASRGASTGGSAWLGSGFSELWWRRPLEAALGITPPLLELDTALLCLGVSKCPGLNVSVLPRKPPCTVPCGSACTISSSLSRRRDCPHLEMRKQPRALGLKALRWAERRGLAPAGAPACVSEPGAECGRVGLSGPEAV